MIACDPPYTISGGDQDTLFLNGRPVAPGGDPPVPPNLREVRAIARLQAEVCAALRTASESEDPVVLAVGLYQQSALVDTVEVVDETVMPSFVGYGRVHPFRPSWARSGDDTCRGMTRLYENAWNNNVGFLAQLVDGGVWVMGGTTYLRLMKAVHAQDLRERAPLPSFSIDAWNHEHHTDLPEAMARHIRSAGGG